MGSGVVSPATVKRDLARCREAIFYRFGDKMSSARSQRRPAETEDTAAARVTRSSSSAEGDDWVVDMDAAECKITNIRRLDRCCLEHLFSLEEKTNLLLLVAVDDDDALLKGTGAAVHDQQQNEIISLSGRRYYRLHCALSDTKDNVLVTGGPASRMYTQKKFEDDVAGGHRGFQIRYKDTDLVSHFTWKNLMAHPLSIMFFGPPLSSSRSFDSIFQDVKSQNSLHHKFMCYYDHFFGDANACMSLLNAYLARRLHLLEAKYTKDVAKVRSPNGGIFKTKAARDFLKKVNLEFEKGFRSVATEFKDHNDPIVPVKVIRDLIAEAERVYGDVWTLMMDLRGAVGTRDGSKRDLAEKKMSERRKIDVFFSLMVLARMANRQNVTYWALVSNVASMARGVGRAAESAFSYFGPTLSNGARRLLFHKVTGNNKEGRATNNTLKHKWTRLFATCRALTLTFDNYQRGVTLQHQ